MKISLLLPLALAAICVGPGFGAETVKASTSTLSAATVEPTSRTVEYRADDILQLHTRLRYQIALKLPDKEKVISAASGDKDVWPINWIGNLVFIKAERAGAKTNGSVVCQSGNVYSFVVSEDATVPPDLKVIVNLVDTQAVRAMSESPKYISAEEAAELRSRAEKAEADAAKARADAEKRIAATKLTAADQAATEIVHDYVVQNKRKVDAFHVAGIYHDNDFTFIEFKAKPSEAPSFFARRDGKDQLVQSDYDESHIRYKITGVVNQGMLRIGKQKIEFKRKTS